MNRAFVAGLFAIVILVSARPALAQNVTVTDSSPPEWKLAAIDCQCRSIPQSTARQYAQLLDDIDKKCKEDRGSIGDIVAKGVKLLLSEKGVTLTHLRFLQAMSMSMPPGSQTLGLACADIATLLVLTITRP